MNEILKLLNALSADELDGVIMRANIMLEKKRKEEAEKARQEEERRQQEKIERERQRQAEIAELQRRLQELQNQSADVTVAPMQRSTPVVPPVPAPQPAPVPKPAPAPQPAPVPKPAPVQQPAMVFCPNCGQKNVADSLFCASCGQRIGNSQPSPQQPAPAPKPAPVAAAPAKPVPQVRKPDESVMKWEKLPGETVIRAFHEIVITKPAMENKAYYMEVTNKRILLSSQSVIAKNAGAAFGLVGSLVRELAHAGPKPCLEIPLAAVSACGEYGKKEYFIEADQTYVLKNKGYDKFLPELVAKAKQGG